MLVILNISNGIRIVGLTYINRMMKVLFAGNKERGISCLSVVKEKYKVVGVIGHKKTNKTNHFVDEAKKMGFKVFQPENVNNQNFIKEIKALAPDITILAGYGPIVKRDFISLSKYGCINLHGGKLPKYRGSSPMNWASPFLPSVTSCLVSTDYQASTLVMNLMPSPAEPSPFRG